MYGTIPEPQEKLLNILNWIKTITYKEEEIKEEEGGGGGGGGEGRGGGGGGGGEEEGKKMGKMLQHCKVGDLES